MARWWLTNRGRVPVQFKGGKESCWQNRDTGAEVFQRLGPSAQSKNEHFPRQAARLYPESLSKSFKKSNISLQVARIKEAIMAHLQRDSFFCCFFLFALLPKRVSLVLFLLFLFACKKMLPLLWLKAGRRRRIFSCHLRKWTAVSGFDVDVLFAASGGLFERQRVTNRRKTAQSWAAEMWPPFGSWRRGNDELACHVLLRRVIMAEDDTSHLEC